VVRVTESLALAEILVARVQVNVLTVQIQPPVASVSAVAVNPTGSAIFKTTEL
jgi:hypothetical protein